MSAKFHDRANPQALACPRRRMTGLCSNIPLNEKNPRNACAGREIIYSVQFLVKEKVSSG